MTVNFAKMLCFCSFYFRARTIAHAPSSVTLPELYSSCQKFHRLKTNPPHLLRLRFVLTRGGAIARRSAELVEGKDLRLEDVRGPFNHSCILLFSRLSKHAANLNLHHSKCFRYTVCSIKFARVQSVL